VETRGRTAPGFQASRKRPRPNEVTISGPRTLVQAVASVVAVIDYSGTQATREFTCRLEARDARGMPVQGVAIDPPTAEVEVAVEAVNVKAVPVHVDLSGPRGRTVAAIDVSPLIVTITGSPEALRRIDSVPTRSLRVDGDTVLPNVELQLPPGVSVVGDQPSVRVAVTFHPMPTPRPRPAAGAPAPPSEAPAAPTEPTAPKDDDGAAPPASPPDKADFGDSEGNG